MTDATPPQRFEDDEEFRDLVEQIAGWALRNDAVPVALVLSSREAYRIYAVEDEMDATGMSCGIGEIEVDGLGTVFLEDLLHGTADDGRT